MKLKTKVTQTISMTNADMAAISNILHEAMRDVHAMPENEGRAANEFLRLVSQANSQVIGEL